MSTTNIVIHLSFQYLGKMSFWTLSHYLNRNVMNIQRITSPMLCRNCQKRLWSSFNKMSIITQGKSTSYQKLFGFRKLYRFTSLRSSSTKTAKPLLPSGGEAKKLLSLASKERYRLIGKY